MNKPDEVMQDGPHGPLISVLYAAFQQNYHLDCSNAAIHVAPVRFSPLTFRLAEHISDHVEVSATFYPDVHTVMLDRGQYEEDPGR